MGKIFNGIGKVVVCLIILMLIAGLALWGIADVVNSSGNQTVAKVGKIEITESDIENETALARRQLYSQNLPEELTNNFLQYIRQNAISKLVSDTLLLNEAKKMKLAVDSSQLVKTDYLSMPGFGKEQLKAIASQKGGEALFIKEVTDKKKADFIKSALTAVYPIPEEVIQKIHNFMYQTRKISYLKIPQSLAGDMNTVNESELIAYYNDKKGSYLAPEFRAISYVSINKNSITEKVDENDDDYEEQVDELVYNTSADLLDKLAEGLELEEAANSLGLEVKKYSSISKDGKNPSRETISDIPNVENFLDATFSLYDNETSDLLESADGSEYAIIKLDEIIPQRIKALDEVKGTIVEDFKREYKISQIRELATDLATELLESKTTLEKLAKDKNLKIKTEKKLDRRNKNFPSSLTTQVFELKKGGYSNAYQTEDGEYVIARLETVNKTEESDQLNYLETKTRIQDEVYQEIVAQYLSHLQTKYEIDLN